ncbi:MAG: VWA domain-containing protein [Deltaproteobacteria bacterium]|nr:VWA domain-containing protein [Deltaproteobacteria bacterium]
MGYHLTGLDAATLLKAGGVVAALVVVLYILKLRRRPIAVPFASLWKRVLRDREATSLFSQLKRLLSLLLQLALLTLLLGALGDPRLAATSTTGRHVVVLLDASASMKATDVPQPPPSEDAAAVRRTRLDVSKDRLRQVVRGLSGVDRMLVAQLDAAVTPLSTMTGDTAELDNALEVVRAVDVRANYAAGLRFAVDSLRGLANPEIVVASDGALGEAVDGRGAVDLTGIKLTYIKAGDSAESRNIAISGLSVRRYPLDKSRYEVLVEVTNTMDRNVTVELELLGDGKVTDLTELTLAGKESVSRFYPNLSGADRSLEARVRLKDGVDDLPADDRAFALLPERRRARVQVVTEGNMYLDAALLLDEFLEVVQVAPAAYPAEGGFDVTIFDGVAPKVQKGSGGLFYLAPPSDEHTPFKLGDALKNDKTLPLGFDELEDKHPLVRHLSLGEVNVGKARALEATERKDVSVGRSLKGTLLLAGRRKGKPFVAMGFDVRDSDLPLRVAWPLLVMNVIAHFIDEDTGYISSFRTGEVWNIPAAAGGKTATLTLPDGGERIVPVKDGRAIFLGQDAGVYELALDDTRTRFAANLAEPLESNIAPAESLAVGDVRSGEVEGFTVGVRRELWIEFLLAVLAVSVIEWLTYHRRVTV